MNRPATTRHAPATARSRADTWIRRTAGVTVAGLAGIAGALSYSHMRQLAEAHGNAGWHAHTFPLSVDGVEIVASLVLLADRRIGRRSGWLPWAALLVGISASLAANVATADPGTVSQIIAGWPALALLIAVKLLSGMLEHRDAGDDASAVPGPASRISGRSAARATGTCAGPAHVNPSHQAQGGSPSPIQGRRCHARDHQSAGWSVACSRRPLRPSPRSRAAGDRAPGRDRDRP